METGEFYISTISGCVIQVLGPYENEDDGKKPYHDLHQYYWIQCILRGNIEETEDNWGMGSYLVPGSKYTTRKTEEWKKM